MESIPPSVWFPVVTLVAGIFLKAIFDAWSENRKARFDKEVRAERRKEIILLQRIDLQRKALGDLQVALAEMVRSTSVIQTHDTKMYRENGEWGASPTPEGVSENSMKNFRAVTLMKVRVSDESVRSLSGQLSALCTKVTLSRTEYESEEAWQAAAVFYSDINEKIGEALRALESEEQALLS